MAQVDAGYAWLYLTHLETGSVKEGDNMLKQGYARHIQKIQ